MSDDFLLIPEVKAANEALQDIDGRQKEIWAMAFLTIPSALDLIPKRQSFIVDAIKALAQEKATAVGKFTDLLTKHGQW